MLIAVSTNALRLLSVIGVGAIFIGATEVREWDLENEFSGTEGGNVVQGHTIGYHEGFGQVDLLTDYDWLIEWRKEQREHRNLTVQT